MNVLIGSSLTGFGIGFGLTAYLLGHHEIGIIGLAVAIVGVWLRVILPE